MSMLRSCWQCRAPWAGFELASKLEVVQSSQHSVAPSQGTNCMQLTGTQWDEWFHPVQCNHVSAYLKLVLRPLTYAEGTQYLLVWNVMALLKSALRWLKYMMLTCPKLLNRPQCLGASPCDYIVVTFQPTSQQGFPWVLLQVGQRRLGLLGEGLWEWMTENRGGSDSEYRMNWGRCSVRGKEQEPHMAPLYAGGPKHWSQTLFSEGCTEGSNC